MTMAILGIPSKYIDQYDDLLIMEPIGHQDHLYDLQGKMIAMYQESHPEHKMIRCMEPGCTKRFYPIVLKTEVKKIKELFLSRILNKQEVFQALQAANMKSRENFIQYWQTFVVEDSDYKKSRSEARRADGYYFDTGAGADIGDEEEEDSNMGFEEKA